MKGRNEKNIEICSRDPAFKVGVFFFDNERFTEASLNGCINK